MTANWVPSFEKLFDRFRELFTKGRNQKLTPEEKAELRKVSKALASYLKETP